MSRPAKVHFVKNLHWFCSTASLLLIFFTIAASADTKTVPCGTDTHGKPLVFNAANGNPYSCTITITTNKDGSEDVLIHQPVVSNKNGFQYTAIVFKAGDLVTISADGCVQTAGSGATWKKYVNPQGSDSGPHVNNGLYFGTVSINGGFVGNTPVVDMPLDDLGAASAKPAKHISVQAVQSIPGHPNPQALTLGYKDDNYDDHGGNGYWGHDDGNNNQCANTKSNAPFGSFGGPAFVKLHIVHNAAKPPAGAVARQWDLVPHGLDINGLPFNPEWGWQVNGGKLDKEGKFDPSCLPGCSSQDPSFDSAGLTSTNWPSHLFANVCNFDTGPAGHHNWFDVAYQGHVRWVEHSGGAFGDDDYNMALDTPIYHFDPPGQQLAGWGAGTTFGNDSAEHAPGEAAIGIEFDSDETIDNFDQNAFWKKFHQTVDGNTDDPYGSDAAAGGMIDYHDVVIIGLMGFDEMHDTYTEIHPVHALAIREGSPVYAGDTLDPSHDRWVFFVRNWGDEGECSQYQHYLQTNTITLQIPPPPLEGVNPTQYGTATLTEKNSQVLGTGTDGMVHFYSGPEGTFVTFNLSAAVSQPFAYGEFELSWKPVAGGPGAHRPPLTHHQTDHKPETRTNPEGRLETIWKATTPAQRQLYTTLLTSLTPPKREIAVTRLKVEVHTTPPKRPAKAPAVTVGPAEQKQRRAAARLQALCAATGGKLPTQPTWCPSAKVPPVTVLTTTGNKATLVAYDASGLGIGATEYSLDGKTWKKYDGPFTLPNGAYTLYHRSQDKQGNMEDARQKLMKMNVSEHLPQTAPPAQH